MLSRQTATRRLVSEITFFHLLENLTSHLWRSVSYCVVESDVTKTASAASLQLAYLPASKLLVLRQNNCTGSRDLDRLPSSVAKALMRSTTNTSKSELVRGISKQTAPALLVPEIILFHSLVNVDLHKLIAGLRAEIGSINKAPCLHSIYSPIALNLFI